MLEVALGAVLTVTGVPEAAPAPTPLLLQGVEPAPDVGRDGALAAAEALANGAAVPARKGDSGGGSVGRPGTAARKKKAADDKEVAACVAALVGQKDADGCNCVVVASAEGHREMVRLLDQFL